MKASGRVVSIMLAAVVLLSAFLLVSSVGKRRDGFQEGAAANKPAVTQATAVGGVTKKAPPAK